MPKEPERVPHRGSVVKSGEKIAEVDYFVDKWGIPRIPFSFLSTLPTLPDKLTLVMDDERKLDFGVIKTGDSAAMLADDRIYEDGL
jgi:hypothetical protein